ncbi:hypothetical protein DAI22_10g123800 [Oryza sativa Japonica Group]|nr:hypothetical protein DAI22_10g123800 [Oryza sativa Japonica Group]
MSLKTLKAPYILEILKASLLYWVNFLHEETLLCSNSTKLCPRAEMYHDSSTV